MGEMGLRPAQITGEGDLMLPDGSVAVARDVAHIYRQRGMASRAKRRDQQKALAVGDSQNKHALVAVNSSTGWSKFATKKEKREQRRVVAVLRKAQHHESNLAVYGALKGPKYKRRMCQNMPHFMKG